MIKYGFVKDKTFIGEATDENCRKIFNDAGKGIALATGWRTSIDEFLEPLGYRILPIENVNDEPDTIGGVQYEVSESGKILRTFV